MKRTNITCLSELQLRKIVRETVERYVSKLNKPKCNFRIEGKTFDHKKVIQSITDRWSMNNKLNESLIKSYPSEKVRSNILRKFNLEDSQVEIVENETDEGIIDLISVILPKNSAQELIGNIKNEMNYCGYHLSNKEMKPYCGGSVYGVLIFEPNYSKDISQKVRKKCKYLYHCTDTVYIDKILKKGLIPKKKNSIYLFPDRVYCMKGDNLSMAQIESLYNIQQAHNKTIPQLDNPKETLDYYLLTIDISKLPQDLKMYSDPFSKGAIFTNDNIPPYAIIDVQPFTLSKA